MKKSGFIKNAFILTLTSLVLRTIGIFFRVFLSNKLGAEGMGLYQLIISIYVLGSTFATSGICTAVTRLVAEELVSGTRQSVRHILRRAISISLLLGILSLLLLYLGAETISRLWLKDMRAVPALRILCFGFPFMGVSSCLRGYFIARRKVASPSGAQILEQMVRIAVVILLIEPLLSRGIAYACMAVLIGDTVAETVSCLTMGISYLLDKRRIEDTAVGKRKPTYAVMKKITAIAAPITAGRYLHTILRTVENILVPDRLTRFTKSKEVALSQFGILKGMAMPLIFFPSSFLGAMSTLLLPEVSSANALGQIEKVQKAVRRTLHITLTSAILISGVFFLFSDDLGILFYGSSEVGFYLKILAPLMPIMYVESVVDGILKGLNQQVSSLKYSVADSAIRIVLIVLILPSQGMKGFLFIMLVSNVLTSFLNVHRLLTVTHMRLDWGKWVFKPLLAVSAGGAAAMMLQRLTFVQNGSTLLTLLMGGATLCGVFCLLLPLFGCVDRKSFQQL